MLDMFGAQRIAADLGEIAPEQGGPFEFQSCLHVFTLILVRYSDANNNQTYWGGNPGTQLTRFSFSVFYFLKLN
jgi:hypothetical protein